MNKPSPSQYESSEVWNYSSVALFRLWELIFLVIGTSLSSLGYIFVVLMEKECLRLCPAGMQDSGIWDIIPTASALTALWSCLYLSVGQESLYIQSLEKRGEKCIINSDFKLEKQSQPNLHQMCALGIQAVHLF